MNNQHMSGAARRRGGRKERSVVADGDGDAVAAVGGVEVKVRVAALQ
jgi:hypothetical protein